jgi:chemotaxis protein histidine kinase CheA
MYFVRLTHLELLYTAAVMLKLPYDWLQMNVIEGRLKFAEKMAQQRKERQGAAAAAAAPGEPTSRNSNRAIGTATQQPAAAAHQADIDALAAEIEALGSSSTAAAAASSSKKSKKQEKLKKQRAKEQQKQQQQRSAKNSSREPSEEEETTPSGSNSAAAGSSSSRVEQQQQQQIKQQQGPDKQQHAEQQFLQKAKQQQQLLTNQQQQAEQRLLQQPRQQQKQQQRQPPTIKHGLRGDAFRPLAEQQQKQQSQAETWWRQEHAGDTAAGCFQPLPLSPPPAAAAVTPDPATGKQGSVMPAAVAPVSLPPPLSAIGSTSAAAVVGPGSAAPSVLQNWRGSRNPIFMYNRPGSSGSRADCSTGGCSNTYALPPSAVVLPAAVHTTQMAHGPPQQQLPGAQPGSSTTAAVQTETSNSSSSSSGVRPRKKCIVCMDRPRDVLLLPCKHLVLCSGCAEQMEGRGALDSCPYCRQACSKRVRVHQ